MVRTDENHGRITALIGGQYGSEGKGKFAAYLANEYGVHVRSGGPNAGHTIDHDDEWYKMQSIPCGWVNPDATLVITRGALVDAHQIETELGWIDERYDVASRLLIDSKAFLVDERHRGFEGGTHGENHNRNGSTGEGIGAARVARMNRDSRFVNQVQDLYDSGQYKYLDSMITPNTSDWLNMAYDTGLNILLEGTQGWGLSLIHGPWPYVTSADTGASALLSDAGLSPRILTDTIMVIRTHPIRVAGNSGPLKHEITWEELSNQLGREAIERTTVTKKVRRVGRWDQHLVYQAVQTERPDMFALSFVDYINPDDAGKTNFLDLSSETRGFIDYLETFYDVPVSLISTGPKTAEIIDRR